MLNEWLYRRLKDRFGKVKVANEDARASYTVTRIGTELKGSVNEDGENYHVCCPFCRDTKSRLYFSYTYAAKIRTAEGVVHFPPMAHCFNETLCLEKSQNRKQLYRTIILGEAPILFESAMPEKPKEKKVVFPQQLRRLLELPSGHAASAYILSRGFSLEQLDASGFAYVQEDPRPWVHGRIFIPVHDGEGKLVGGQCRRPTHERSDWPPRWFTLTGTPLRYVIYNLDRAQERMLIVTEGVFDAARFGNYGVATFNCRMTAPQFNLLMSSPQSLILFAYDGGFGDKDPKAYEDYRNKLHQLKNGGKTVYEVQMPGGTDPADMREEDAWVLIAQTLERRQQ